MLALIVIVFFTLLTLLFTSRTFDALVSRSKQLLPPRVTINWAQNISHIYKESLDGFIDLSIDRIDVVNNGYIDFLKK